MLGLSQFEYYTLIARGRCVDASKAVSMPRSGCGHSFFAAFWMGMAFRAAAGGLAFGASMER